jgi:hypothetical protein
VLSVAGVADAIHIATYYIGNILIEANERMPTSSYSTYRPSSSHTRRPPSYTGGGGGGGGSSYVPGYSHPYATPPPPPSHGHSNTPSSQLQTQQIYIPDNLVGCIIGKGGSKINEIRHMSASNIKIMEPGAVGVGMNGAPGSAPAGGEGERLVVITGPPANIQMAVQLLYHVSMPTSHEGHLLTSHLVRCGFPALGAGEAETPTALSDFSMKNSSLDFVTSCCLFNVAFSRRMVYCEYRNFADESEAFTAPFPTLVCMFVTIAGHSRSQHHNLPSWSRARDFFFVVLDLIKGWLLFSKRR